jgi:flagellar hook-basal body complex protein FliE
MINSLNPAIAALQRGRVGGPTGPAAPVASPAGEGGEDFGKQLVSALKDVNQTQMDAKNLQEDLMTNRKPVEVHDLMIAMEKAGTAMQLTMSVRNKMLEAYQEISRMQV